MNSLEKRIDMIEIRLSTVEERLDIIEKEIKELKKRMNNFEERQNKLIEEVESLSQTIARIEIEYGEKIQILFDASSLHTQKNNEQDKSIEKIERKIENQGHKIYSLEKIDK